MQKKRIAIKNHYQEAQLIGRRSFIGLAIIGLLILLLLARLAYLQIYRHNVYTTMATKNWLDLVPVEPTRGLIYDRNGVLLAENIPVFSLDVVPIKVKNVSKMLSGLTKIIDLSASDITQFKKQIKQHRRFAEIPLKLRLTEAEVARFTENQHRFPGVFIKARLIRHYPHRDSFSHVIGFVGRINPQELNEIDQTNYSASYYIGKVGIEKYMEDELHGKVGYEEVENDASGKLVRTLNEIKSIPGKNLYLTIDSNLQFIAEKALAGKRGAIVAIQPATGQILALVSNPSYDPNLFVTGISQKEYAALQRSTDRPLFNRALGGLYPLASTIKPFLALKGLDENIITPEYTIMDSGWFQLENSDYRYHDFPGWGHGRVNLAKAITSSCDTYFYELGNKMGIRRIHDILTQFGFGNPTGIDLGGESSGLIATPEWKFKTKGVKWYDGDTIISAIGQGFMQATPLQLANATATLANRGKRFIPYLLLGDQLPSKSYQPQQPIAHEPIKLENNNYWEIVIKAMQNVVDSNHGTARKYGKERDYTIAAKTGTAQIVSKRRIMPEISEDQLPEALRDHHLFIAFAPVDKPELAVAVITENNNAVLSAGRMIFDYYLGKKSNVNR